jgi:H+/Cl- antiporter ClcA
MTQHWLHRLRLSLSDSNSQLHHAALGIISGATCSVIVLLFRFVLESFGLWLPDGNAENFEGLPPWMHFALPFGGALLLGLIIRKMDPADVRVGTVHVISRLHAHQGHLPLRNTLWQFFAGIFALATGQSGGREGPAIHLGAGANSLMAHWLGLPNNTRRILVGCGTAAAIAGSFNTPIAGVIFAMEVIMMEYTIAGFIPIILAATTATMLTRMVFGSEPELLIQNSQLQSLTELPFIAVMGLVVGACATLYVLVLKTSLKHNKRPAMQRMLIAGICTGALAFIAPQIMGIGYDSLNQALAGELALGLLITLVFAKILATTVSAGMGLPVGIIGPCFLIGAGIGSAMGIISLQLHSEVSDNSLYVLLGMGAMMGAVMNAPLAALMALVELTQSTDIIFPGMLIITVALLTRSEIFKQPSANQAVLDDLQQVIRTDPVSMALNRTSVGSLMSYDLKILPGLINHFDAQELIDKPPHWAVISSSAEQYVLRGKELAKQLAIHCPQDNDSTVLLSELPLNKIQLCRINLRSTLHEALDAMDQQGADIALVSEQISGEQRMENGIVTRGDIDHYLYPRA